jgi:hypothetical protein
MTTQVEDFPDDLYESDPVSHRLVNQAVLVLERNDPAEGRPLVDTLTASAIARITISPGQRPCGGSREGAAAPVGGAERDPGVTGVRSVAVGGAARRRRQVWQVDAVEPHHDPAGRPAIRRLPGRTREGDAAVSDVSRWRGLGASGARRADRRRPGGLQCGGLRHARRRPQLAAGRKRKRRGLTQEQVANRMGVSVARGSQIGSGDVSSAAWCCARSQTEPGASQASSSRSLPDSARPLGPHLERIAARARSANELPAWTFRQSTTAVKLKAESPVVSWRD